MRILQLIQKPQLRGAEIFSAQLSENLQTAGHEVHLVSLFSDTANLPFTGKTESLNRSLSNRLLDIKGWYVLHQYIKKNKPDIVQANAGDTLKFAVFSKLIFGWKTPIIFRNANKVSDFIHSRMKLWFNSFLVKQVAHVASVSEMCKEDFIQTYTYPIDKITTLPIGINFNKVNTEIPNDLQSIFAKGKVLVHVASFVPEKNHTGLLKIFKKLADGEASLQLLLIGDGYLRSKIESEIRALGLENNVTLLGYRQDVLSIVSNASVFLLPSLIEGLPGVILEAMYCKTPVVAYNVGGISEVVQPGKTGWLIGKQNEDEFILAVKEVLNNSVSSITDQAYQHVINKYSNKQIASNFESLYKKVVYTFNKLN